MSSDVSWWQDIYVSVSCSSQSKIPMNQMTKPASSSVVDISLSRTDDVQPLTDVFIPLETIHPGL